MALKTPYSQTLPQPLQANTKIGIDAFFKDDGDKFTVMLLCNGDEEMADAMLILEIDGSPLIKLSYRKDGVKSDPQLILDWEPIKGQQLKVFIEAESDHFKIVLNEKFKATFTYRFPLKLVKYIWIDGDIKLNKVTVQDHE